MKLELVSGFAAGRVLFLGLIVEWSVVLVWVGIVGSWIYRQGRKRGWWDKTGQEIDAFNARTAPPKAEPEPARAALGRRVLQDRFRTWPRVYQGGTDARPVVTLKARFPSPGSVKTDRFVAALAALVLFMWTERRATAWVPGDDSAWWQANIGPLFWCAVFAFVAFLVMRWLFPRLLWRIPGWQRPLVMRFEGGGITWGRGPRWLKELQFWRVDPRGLVRPGEMRHAEGSPGHRKAEAEAEANAERRARRLKPKPVFYQHASEVLMFVGADLESWREVAELADDPQGQWAKRLASAINEADKLALSLLPKEAAAETPRPVLLVPVPGRRPESPESGGLLE